MVELRARLLNRNYVGTHFVPQDMVDAIRAEAASGRKVLPEFRTEIRARGGEIVARVSKTIYVRLKPAYRPSTGTPDAR